MLDSVAIWPVGLRVLDVNGKPVSDARLKFYNAGTSTERVVYADAALTVQLGAVVYTDAGGYPVTGSGSTTKTDIYTGVGAYKVRITTAADVDIVAPLDNRSGALDTTAILAGAGTFNRTVLSRTSDFTVDATKSGAIYQCNPTSSTFTGTFPDALVAGDGFTFAIRHDGSLNQVKFASVSSQPIHLPGGVTTSGGVLTAYGHTMEFVCDGAGWTVNQETPALIGGTKGFITIASRLSSPPATPVSGARHIISGTPTGEWATRTVGDVAESNGQGGWTYYTPPTNCGWLAYIVTENMLTQFRDTAWKDLNNITAPNVSTLRRMVVSHTAASGTSGGNTSAGVEVVRPFNSVDENTITTANGASGDASLASYQLTLPASSYLIVYSANVFNVNATTSRLKSTTTAKEVASNNAFAAQVSGDSNIAIGMGILTLTAPEVFELRHKAAVTDANGLGRANGISGQAERHAVMTIIDLASLQGPQGVQGVQGSVGPAGGAGPTGAAAPVMFDITFDTTSTADSDPTPGKWKANNATPASVTTFYIDDLDRLGNSQVAEYATWDDSTSSGVKGKLYLTNLTTPANRWVYDVTAYMAATGYSKLTVVHRSGTAAFASVNMAAQFIPRGDKGADGAGTGDFVGPSASADGEIVLFSGTTGKLGKRSNTLSGIVKATAGVPSAAAASDLGAGLHTIYVPAAAMVSRTTNGAAAGTVETTTNKVMLSTLDFDTTTQEFAQFSIRMPKSWNEGTVTASFAWSHASTTTNFGVAWAIEGVAISDGDAGDAAFGTAQQVADTGGTTNTLYVTAATSAVTIAGTPAAEDWVVFQVKRVPADAADTMAIDARLHGVTLYFTTDALTDA